MKVNTKNILQELLMRYPSLAACGENIEKAFSILKQTYESGKKVLLCGNGGSAADCEHIVGELMKSFKKKRGIPQRLSARLQDFGEMGQILQTGLEGGLPTLSLTSHLALSTAFSNDKEPTLTFAQQLSVLGNEGDCLLCISTSGNSKNCVLAACLAKAMGIKVISLTGENASALTQYSDVCIRVPETETFKVQELHLPIYHALCAALEEEFF